MTGISATTEPRVESGPDASARLRWRRATRLPRVPAWALVLTGLWATLVIGFNAVCRLGGLDATPCIFRTLTGLPCPTCGLTRAVAAAGRGDIATAWRWNPLAVSVLGVAAAGLLVRFVTARRLEVRLPRRHRRAAWCAAAGLFALNWGYLIATH